jgi:hypothetical protein
MYSYRQQFKYSSLFFIISIITTDLYSMDGRSSIFTWQMPDFTTNAQNIFRNVYGLLSPASSPTNTAPNTPQQALVALPAARINLHRLPTVDSVWQFIMETYGTRVRLLQPIEPTRLRSSVYYENRFNRSCYLLAEYMATQPPEYRAVLRTVLEELRIIPSRERGIIDSFQPISRSGLVIICRLLCFQPPVSELRISQRIISFLSTLHREDLKAKLRILASHENYFLATFIQQASPINGNPLEVLKLFFTETPVDTLCFFARSPLAYTIAESFSPENVLRSIYEQQIETSNFWKEHCEGLCTFLNAMKALSECLKDIVQNCTDTSTNQKIRGWQLRLWNKDYAHLLKQLQSFLKNNIDSFELNILYCHIGKLLELIHQQRVNLLAAYAAVGEIDTFSYLASCVSDQSFCFPIYSEQTETPLIIMNEGRCLLLREPTAYSCHMGNGNQLSAVVTGANGAGKSIFLNTVGVAAHLALSLGITPARSLELTPLTIRTSCNIHDSIAQRQSLFESQAARIGEIMESMQHGEFSLIILDEPITSTNHQIANTFVIKILEHLQSHTRALSLTSTHHPQPIDYADNHPEHYLHYVIENNHTLVAKPNKKEGGS